MSYTQHIWRPSDIITADRLNNIEEGIVSLGHGKIKCIDNYYDEPSGHHILDISIEEIYQYVKDGYKVFFYNEYPNFLESGKTGKMLCKLNYVSFNPEDIWSGGAEFSFGGNTRWFYPNSSFPGKLVWYYD